MKRVLVATVMTLILTTGLIAQRGRGGPGGAGGGNPATALKSALNLTDAQVEAIKGLWQAEQTRMQSIRTEIEQQRQTLDTLLDAATPNAVQVGNAAIALHASQAKIEAERTAFLNQVKQQLTGEQQQKLDTLLAARGGRGLLPGLGGGPGRRR
jgi:Spy/CpxP family protein refolding chaperone